METTQPSSGLPATADIKIRWALPEDLTAGMELAEALHSEASWYSDRPFDRDYAADQFLSRINGVDRFSFVAEVDGLVVGVLFGFFTKLLTCDVKLAVEEVLFVHPQFRSLGVGFALIGAMDRWAVFNKAQFSQVGISTGITPEKTDRLYKGIGFQPFSDSYIKELDYGRQ